MTKQQFKSAPVGMRRSKLAALSAFIGSAVAVVVAAAVIGAVLLEFRDSFNLLLNALGGEA